MLVPLTVYFVIESGSATGLGQLMQFSPVDGDHKYVEAPVAEREIPIPLHIIVSTPAFVAGSG